MTKFSEICGKQTLWRYLWLVTTDNITSSRPGPLVNAPVLSLKYKIQHILSNKLHHFPLLNVPFSSGKISAWSFPRKKEMCLNGKNFDLHKGHLVQFQASAFVKLNNRLLRNILMSSCSAPILQQELKMRFKVKIPPIQLLIGRINPVDKFILQDIVR